MVPDSGAFSKFIFPASVIIPPMYEFWSTRLAFSPTGSHMASSSWSRLSRLRMVR